VKDFFPTEAPLIYLITKGETTDQNFTEKKTAILNLIKIACQTKISLIQIREKHLSARFVFELAGEAVKIARGTKTKILINDRADIALAAKADGVHLTSGSLSAETIRRAFAPKNFIIGVSAHSIEDAENAKHQSADFAAFSPIFPSPGKGNLRGIERLKTICEQLKPFPIIALGGVDETNRREVLEAGASGFAAIRFLNDEENLIKLAADLRRERSALM
jgi:thiamine-phosphate pyrophosphorylase